MEHAAALLNAKTSGLLAWPLCDWQGATTG
jgi:hypothetical protein